MELPTLTNDINTIIPLALLMSIAYFYARLSKKRLGYFDKYIQSTSILLPVNILEARAQMLIIYINMCEHFFGLILNYKVYFIYIYIYIYIYNLIYKVFHIKKNDVFSKFYKSSLKHNHN